MNKHETDNLMILSASQLKISLLGNGRTTCVKTVITTDRYFLSNIVVISPHEFVFSVGWNERDCVLRLELAKLYALVKLAIVNSNRTFGSAGFFARLS